ncbi:MAG: universal stress protein [Halobacteriota archaeon]
MACKEAVSTQIPVTATDKRKARAAMYKCILIPISNPKNAEHIIKAALKLLDKDGVLVLLGVLLTRDSFPDHTRNYRDKANLVIRLMKLVQQQNVEVIPEVINAPSVYDAIIEQIARHNVDLTILGYSQRSPLYKIRYGDIIYPVMRDAQSDVILSNLKNDSAFKRILVPSAGYKHSLAAVRIAAALASPAQGHITLLHITGENESTVADDLKRLAAMYENVSIEVRAGPVVEQITETAKDYDALIMGASERSRGASVIFGTVVDKVIERASSNVLIVRV